METEKQDQDIVKKEIDRAEVRERPKKSYSTPKLTKFGHVEEFTGTIPTS